MLIKNDIPILEFDDGKTAKFNPSDIVSRPLTANKLVITFFHEVIEKLLAERVIEEERIISGENPITLYRFTDAPDHLIVHGAVGCPACAGNLDLFHAMGIDKVMFCGGGGVLDSTLGVGQFVLVDGAIRDDGFSYHYYKASRCLYTKKETTDAIAAYLDEHKISYQRGLVWTTDAIFRETADRIEARRAEGAKIVEMEQAGCIAVSNFRDFSYGAIIYGGDDVSAEEWNDRSWRSRNSLRYDLVLLCRTLVDLI